MALRQVDKNSRKFGAGGNGRTEGKRLKIAVGAAGFLLITWVPAAIAWLQGHEMACGWSSGWQRFAGWFGDCAGYAQKPSQTVVITGPAVPQGPVPRAVVYNEQLKQYRLARDDGDQEFLNKLYQSGFRLKSNSACNGWDWIAFSSPVDVAVSRAKVELKFSESPVTCSGRAVDAHLLQDLLDEVNRVCKPVSNLNEASWKSRIAVIDELVSARGPSESFKETARSAAIRFDKARSVNKEEVVELCVRAFDPDLPWDRRMRERKEGDTVFGVHRACKSIYEAATMLEADANAPISVGRNRSESHRRAICQSAVKGVGLHEVLRPIDSALSRWVR